MNVDSNITLHSQRNNRMESKKIYPSSISKPLLYIGNKKVNRWQEKKDASCFLFDRQKMKGIHKTLKTIQIKRTLDCYFGHLIFWYFYYISFKSVGRKIWIGIYKFYKNMPFLRDELQDKNIGSSPWLILLSVLSFLALEFLQGLVILVN